MIFFTNNFFYRTKFTALIQIKWSNKVIQHENNSKLWWLAKHCEIFARKWAAWFACLIPNQIVWI